MKTNNNDNDRQRFEKFIESVAGENGYKYKQSLFKRDPVEGYATAWVDMAWMGWCEALKEHKAVEEPEETILTVKEHQLEKFIETLSNVWFYGTDSLWVFISCGGTLCIGSEYYVGNPTRCLRLMTLNVFIKECGNLKRATSTLNNLTGFYVLEGVNYPYRVVVEE